MHNRASRAGGRLQEVACRSLEDATRAQEGLLLRCASAKEDGEMLHDLARAARPEDLLAVRHASLLAHAVGLESRGEHIGRDDFCPHVAIVCGAVLIHQVAKGAQEVGTRRVADASDLRAHPVDERLQSVGRGRWFGPVQCEVEHREVNLPRDHLGGVHILGGDQRLAQPVGQRLARLVVLREPRKHRWLPAPVLEHLARGLDEVARALG
mmetsp:Transcript_32677/g.85871  ORF Transcript_32677/g.85871 Transcript_32677/m.85871 type:complete len:210 (-) Transcript_32677:40-669(-)